MPKKVPPQVQDVKQARKTLRLTFRIADKEIRLLSHQRLDMICPPAIGEIPQMGTHGGFWIELRDSRDHVLFHRVLDNPLGDSVEVHSPEGKPERVFDVPEENIFEVLLPDDSRARNIVLIGESLEPVKKRKEPPTRARELARFEVPKGTRGNTEIEGGSHDRI